MMHGKIIWKHRIGAIAKASRGIAPETHKVRGGPYESPVAMAVSRL